MSNWTSRSSFATELSSKIECPVCLDIPELVQYQYCPNGHSVCSSARVGPAQRVGLSWVLEVLLAAHCTENWPQVQVMMSVRTSPPLAVIQRTMKPCVLTGCPVPSSWHTLCPWRFLSGLSQHWEFQPVALIKKHIAVIKDWNCLTFSTSIWFGFQLFGVFMCTS